MEDQNKVLNGQENCSTAVVGQNQKFKFAKLLVIYGATGDLMDKKLVKALWLLWVKQFPLEPWDRVILTGGSGKFNDKKALKKFLRNRCQLGKGQGSLFRDFAATFEFVQARCSDPSGFPTIKQAVDKWLQDQASQGVIDPALFFYFSIPLSGNIPTMQNMASLDLFGWSKKFKQLRRYCLLEKPSAVREVDVDALKNAALAAGFKTEDVRQVDHFAFKAGFRAMIEWLYKNKTRDLSFSSSFRQLVKHVVVYVSEELDSAGRDYPGVMIDSVLNHCMCLLAPVLSNPTQVHDPAQAFESIMDEMSNYLSETRAKGILGYCPTDPSCGMPTGAYLTFYPKVNRYPGMTPFTIIHLKNGAEKTMEVQWFFNEGPPERATFHIASFTGGGWWHDGDAVAPVEYCGYSRIARGFNVPQEQTVNVERRHAQVPKVLADGYPTLIEEWLGENHSYFMTLDFQRHVIAIVRPWARVLHFHGKSNGIEYPRGKNPFKPRKPTGCGSTKDDAVPIQDLLLPLDVPEDDAFALLEERLRDIEEDDDTLRRFIEIGLLDDGEQAHVVESGMLKPQDCIHLASKGLLDEAAIACAVKKGIITS